MKSLMPYRTIHSEPGLNIRLCWYQPEIGMPAHSHDMEQLSVLLAGGFGEISDGRSRDVLPAMIGYKPSGLDHENHYGDRGALILSINFDRTHIPGAADWQWCTMTAQQEELVQNLLSTAGHESDCRNAALDLLSYCAEGLGMDRLPPAWAKELRELLMEEPATDLDAFARQKGLHRAHISRGFRKWFNTSPSRFALKARLGQALAHLSSGESKADAALAAGFSDQSHLTRMMKREARLTPGAFCRLLAA